MSDTNKRLSKSWSRYLIEFLMLFLAVFLGFFVDNLRDQSTEKVREREYIRSLIEDVQSDQIQIKQLIHNNNKRKSYLDSLSKLCYSFNPDNPDIEGLYKFMPIVLARPDFFNPNELTLSQLKNAGGMRLIKSKTAIQEIWKYDFQGKKLVNQQEYYENYHNNSINYGVKIFSLKQAFNIDSLTANSGQLGLLTYDRKDIIEFGNYIVMYSGIVDYYNLILKDTKAQSDTLIKKLKIEYKMK